MERKWAQGCVFSPTFISMCADFIWYETAAVEYQGGAVDYAGARGLLKVV
jgi:hypothetical protein